MHWGMSQCRQRLGGAGRKGPSLPKLTQSCEVANAQTGPATSQARRTQTKHPELKVTQPGKEVEPPGAEMPQRRGLESDGAGRASAVPGV